MSKRHNSGSAAHLERRLANKARRERSDWVWTVVMLVIMLGVIMTVVAIQISHHI